MQAGSLLFQPLSCGIEVLRCLFHERASAKTQAHNDWIRDSRGIKESAEDNSYPARICCSATDGFRCLLSGYG